MEFTIDSFRKNEVDIISLKNRNNGEYVEILPSLGGTVHKILFLSQGELNHILFYDQENEIKENPLFRGRMLFPFSSRIPNGQYCFDNQTFQLSLKNTNLPFALHGLIYNQPFEIKEKSSDSQQCSLTLRYKVTQDRFQGYPFEIEFWVEYLLKANRLEIRFVITNQGSCLAPISLGWHPYFTFGDTLEGVSVENVSKSYVEVDSGLIPTQNFLSCEGSPFGFNKGQSVQNLALDTTFAESSDGVTILEKGKKIIILTQDKKYFPYTQFYIPDDRKSIAIEPISAATNAFNLHNLGLIPLPPDESITTYIYVETES